jgi:hypothetical protein
MNFLGNQATQKQAAQSRKRYYFDLAKSLGVDKKFVESLFRKDSARIVGEKRMDLGNKIRMESGLFKKTVVLGVPTRKQECTSDIHPQCLKVFITNTDETVCLRCRNYK